MASISDIIQPDIPVESIEPDAVGILLVENQEDVSECAFNVILDHIIKNDVDGIVLWTSFNSTRRFNDSQRCLLSSTIIKHSMPCFQNTLNTKHMLGLAKAVVEKFPGEMLGYYYVPYNKETGKVASGRLWHAYNRYKKKYGLTRKTKNEKEIEKQKNSSSDASRSIDKSTQQALEWLEKFLDPWDNVLVYWKQTYDLRAQLQNNLKIHEYFDRFPGLRFEKKGLDLVESDFSILYENKSNSLIELWPLKKEKICDLLQDRIVKLSVSAKALFLSLSNLTPENQVLPMFILLCEIIPPQLLVQRKNTGEVPCKQTRRKPTTVEIQESLFIHVLNSSDLETVVANRKKELKGSSLQPTPIFAGPLTAIEKSFCLVDEVLYECQSVIHAFQATFQTFFVFHAQYPHCANQVWLLIQRVFFNIVKTEDNFTMQGLAIANELSK